ARVERTTGDERGRTGAARPGEPAAALRAHAVGLERRPRVAARARAPGHARERGPRLSAVSRRQRDVLRAALDLDLPDARVAPERQGDRRADARGTIGVPVQPRLHLPMIYKFKSKATGDVIMMGPNGDQVLRLIGKEPAAKGIIEVAAMPSAMA